MTKIEAIKEIEEYIADADKAIGMDENYIRGWKCAMLVALGIVYSMPEDYYPMRRSEYMNGLS